MKSFCKLLEKGKIWRKSVKYLLNYGVAKGNINDIHYYRNTIPRDFLRTFIFVKNFCKSCGHWDDFSYLLTFSKNSTERAYEAFQCQEISLVVQSFKLQLISFCNQSIKITLLAYTTIKLQRFNKISPVLSKIRHSYLIHKLLCRIIMEYLSIYAYTYMHTSIINCLIPLFNSQN